MDKEQWVSDAQAACGRLADACDIRALASVAELAEYGPHLLRSLLKHQLVCDHSVKMRMAAKVDHYLVLVSGDRSAEDQDRGCREASRLSAASARLSGHFRHGLAALERIERQEAAETRRREKQEDRELGLDDGPDDDGDHPGGGPGRGKRMSPAKLLAQMQALRKAAEAKLNATPKPNGNGNGSHLAALGQRRGALRHGNPSGDFLAAPRCGAKCRAGHPCRQPAMANGRCRLHGGKSTGARTAAGLAKCRTATLVHGGRTAEIIDLRSAAARHARNTRHLVQAVRHHLRSERPTPCPATAERKTAEERRSERMNADRLEVRRRLARGPSMIICGHLRSSVVNPSPSAGPNPRIERPACRSIGEGERPARMPMPRYLRAA